VSVKTGWKPAEAELEELLVGLPAETRSQADKLRALVKESAALQRARLAQFEPLLEGGKPERGRDIFFGKKVACATCHRIGPEGGQVGPDLTKIGAVRAGRDLLESIVLPSSTIAQGFDAFAVETSDGKVASGVITRQNATTIVLRDSSGKE
jgi:putative heme-binding domain-containing protein